MDHPCFEMVEQFALICRKPLKMLVSVFTLPVTKISIHIVKVCAMKVWDDVPLCLGFIVVSRSDGIRPSGGI